MGYENSGRRPQPSALKVLRGNPGKRRLFEREPVPPDGPVVKPAYLSALAAQVWDEIAPGCLAMRTLTGPDVPAFVRLCELEASARMTSQGKGEEAWSQRKELDAAN